MSWESNEITNWEHEHAIAAKRVVLVGSDLQQVVDEDSNSAPIYIGMGAKGLLTSQDGWLITHYTYGSDLTAPSTKSAIGIWDNRASLTYS